MLSHQNSNASTEDNTRNSRRQPHYHGASSKTADNADDQHQSEASTSSSTASTNTADQCETNCKQPSWAVLQEFAIRRCLKAGGAAEGKLPNRPAQGYCKVGQKTLEAIMKDPSGGANAICNFWNQDCKLAPFSKWTGCSLPRCSSKHPKGGTQSRSREILEPAKGLGRSCSTFVTTQKRPCNTTEDVAYRLGNGKVDIGSLVSPVQFVSFGQNKYATLNTMTSLQGAMHAVGPLKTLQLAYGGTGSISAFTFEALIYIPAPEETGGTSQNTVNVPLWSHQTHKGGPAQISVRKAGTKNVHICVMPPVLTGDSPVVISSLSQPSHYKTYQHRHPSNFNSAQTKNSANAPKLSDLLTTGQWAHLACCGDNSPPSDVNEGKPYVQAFVNGNASSMQSVPNMNKTSPDSSGKHYLGTLMKANGDPSGYQQSNPPSCYMFNVRVWAIARTSEEIQAQAGIYLDASGFTADGLSNEMPLAVRSNQVSPTKNTSLPDLAQKCTIRFFQLENSSGKSSRVAPSFIKPDHDTTPLRSSSSFSQVPHVPKGSKLFPGQIPQTIGGYLTTYVHLRDCFPQDCKISCPSDGGDNGKHFVGGCSRNCGGGVRMVECKISQYPCDGGKACPSKSSAYYTYVPCNQQSCIDCQLEPMEKFWDRCRDNKMCWSPCSAPCNGVQYAYRRIEQRAGPNGRPCSQFQRKVQRPCCMQCNCNVCPVGQNNRVCSGPTQGRCVTPAMDKHFSKGHCKCLPGFAGEACGLQCPRSWNGKTCSGNGTCQLALSVRNFFGEGDLEPVGVQLFDQSNSSNAAAYPPDVSHDAVAEQLLRLKPTKTSKDGTRPKSTETALFGDQAVKLPGKGPGLEMADNATEAKSNKLFAQSITVSIWMMLSPDDDDHNHPSSLKGQTVLWHLYSTSDHSDDDDADYMLGFDAHSQKVYGQSGSTAQVSQILENELIPGTWHQWTATYDYPQKQWQIFLDGRPLTSSPQTLKTAGWWKQPPSSSGYTYALNVGNTTHETQHVPFVLDGLVLFLHGQKNPPLSPSQVRDMYASQRTLVMGRYYPPMVPTPPTIFSTFNGGMLSKGMWYPLIASDKQTGQLFTFSSVGTPNSHVAKDPDPVVSAETALRLTGSYSGFRSHSHVSLQEFLCQSLTFHIWVKRPQHPAQTKTSPLSGKITLLALQRSNAATPSDIRLEIDASTNLLWIQGGPSAAQEHKTAVPFDVNALFATPGQWHLFSLVLDHDTQSLQAYINGEPQGKSQPIKPAPWWCDGESHAYTVHIGKVEISGDSVSIDGVQLFQGDALSRSQIAGLYHTQLNVKSTSSTQHMSATTLCRCKPGFSGRACEKGGKCFVVQELADGDKQPRAVFHIDDHYFTQAQCEMMGIATQTSANVRWPPQKGSSTPLLVYKALSTTLFQRVTLQSLTMPHMFYWMPESIFQWLQSSSFTAQLPASYSQLYSAPTPRGLSLSSSLSNSVKASQAFQFVPLLFTAFTVSINRLQEWQWLELSALLNLQVNCGSVYQVLGHPSDRRDGFVFGSQGWAYKKDMLTDTSLNENDLLDLWSNYAALYPYRGCVRTPYRNPSTGKQVYLGERPISSSSPATQPVTRVSKLVYFAYDGSQNACYASPKAKHNYTRYPEIVSASLPYQQAGDPPLKGPQVLDIAYPSYGGFHGHVISSVETSGGIQALAERYGNRDKCFRNPGTIYPVAYSTNTRTNLLKVAKGVVSDDHPTLPQALQLGTQTKGQTYPDKNGSYPQPLADHLNAQCPGLNGRCRPILDGRAEEALCSNSNKRFSAYVFMNHHEAHKHNAQGVGPDTGTGWYYVPQMKLGDSSPCSKIANRCSEFHSCRARTELGTRLVHLNTSDTAGLADVPSFYQCPGSGGTAHAVVQPCLQSTHSVWWNYWSETTKQKWARMLTQVGAKTSANEPDFYRLTRNENGYVVGPQMLARLNSQCDPGKPCQYMNEKGDGYVFRNWATGGGNPKFHWKYVRSAHTQYKNLCQNSDIKDQSYCRKVRDWMCPLGLVYTGNLYGGCFCPLSSSEAPTRTEQRFLSPPNSSVYAGHFRYDVQWREIDKNRYMHLCDKSLSTDSWMHQTYYLSFNELRAKSKNALGHVAYRNHVNMTTSATITMWAQAPQNVKRFPHNGNEYGLWYLAGNQNGDSDEDDLTGTQKAYGLSLIYDADVPQLRLSYQNPESSRLSPFSHSGDLADSDAFYHIAICIHPVDPSDDTTPNATADDNGGQAHSKLVLYINGKHRDSVTSSHRIRIGGETQGKSLKEIYKSNMNSFLGAAEPNAQKFHVGGLHSFRVYSSVLSQKQIKKDMCTQRSPATTPDLVQAFHFNTGAGNELPNADTSVEKQNKERRDQPVVDSSGLLACPPGYEFKKVQPRKGNETYKLCKRKWTT